MFAEYARRATTSTLALALCVGLWGAPDRAWAAEEPVVRADAGNLGLSFTFGGLASMTAGSSEAVNTLIFSQVGLRIVLNENFIFPLYVGFGMQLRDQENTDAQTDFGLRLGGGVEYHFRIWRRISPFIGGGLRIGLDEPAGDNNWGFGFALTPTMGIEYYVGDRLSLIAQYYFNLIFAITDPAFNLHVGTASGGALSAVFYF